MGLNDMESGSSLMSVSFGVESGRSLMWVS